MKTAIVHDWLVTYRGGEKVLQAICEIYPDAPIFTLFYDPTQLPEFFRGRQVIYPKFLNRFRALRKLFLPLYPSLVEAWDLSSYDLIVSTSHCVAKGIIPPPHATHVAYIHSPMRYIWDQGHEYLPLVRKIPLLRNAWEILATYLRLWDTVSSVRADRLVANSSFVQARIRKYYGRPANVVYPPVNLERFLSNPKRAQEYYLCLGAFVSYKRFDLAIAACEAANKPLIIAGDGPDLAPLRRRAGRYTKFVVAPSDRQVEELLAGARALLYPGVEDFGITGIEALAAGTPLIAFARGGSRDYVQDGVNGIFFHEQSSADLRQAMARFEQTTFTEAAVRGSAEPFSPAHFRRQFMSEIAATSGERP